MQTLRFVTILTVLVALSGCRTPTQNNHTNFESIEINGNTFDLELAIDVSTREVGLKNRNSIPETGGMLFVFPRAEIRSFWMHDCLIDIDIIFLDSRGTITAMHRMKAEPLKAADENEFDYQNRLPRYSSVYPAQFAIELRSGWLDRLDLRVDQRIELDLRRLKALPH